MKLPSNVRPRSLPLLALFVLFSGCAPPALYENEYGGILSARNTNTTLPKGMRRTKNGWEDTSFWNISTDIRHRSIDSWMDDQRKREPSWLRRILEEIRTMPPLMIAVIHVTAIAAIVHVSRNQKPEPPS